MRDQPTIQPTITEIMAQVGIGGKPMAPRPPNSSPPPPPVLDAAANQVELVEIGS
jgi:hypothetical protein